MHMMREEDLQRMGTKVGPWQGFRKWIGEPGEGMVRDADGVWCRPGDLEVQNEVEDFHNATDAQFEGALTARWTDSALPIPTSTDTPTRDSEGAANAINAMAQKATQQLDARHAGNVSLLERMEPVAPPEFEGLSEPEVIPSSPALPKFVQARLEVEPETRPTHDMDATSEVPVVVIDDTPESQTVQAANDSQKILIEHRDFKIQIESSSNQTAQAARSQGPPDVVVLPNGASPATDETQAGIPLPMIPKAYERSASVEASRADKKPQAQDEASEPEVAPAKGPKQRRRMGALGMTAIIAGSTLGIGFITGEIPKFVNSASSSADALPTPQEPAADHSPVYVPDWMPTEIAAYRFQIRDLMAGWKDAKKTITSKPFVLVTNPNTDGQNEVGSYASYDIIMDMAVFASEHELTGKYGLLGIPPQRIQDYMDNNNVRGTYHKDDLNDVITWGTDFTNSAMIDVHNQLKKDGQDLSRENHLRDLAKAVAPDKETAKALGDFLVEKDDTWKFTAENEQPNTTQK